jgi:hypothetical protein
MSPGGPLATGSGTMPVGGPGQPQLKVGHNVFTLTVSNAAGSSRCQTDIVMDPDPCGSAMRDLGVAVVMAKEAIDFDNVLTVATVGGLAGAKVALGSMGWISSKFNSAFKGLTGDGLVNAACEELARCKVRFGHADSGELVFFNRLGNPAAICKFNKNADGSVTSEGKMLVKSASDAIKEQLQNAVTPSKP